MTNPTSNYGFVLPTATDLVTDLPADFEVALQGVDTRLKALQPGTTLGDIAYSSATANTNTRLPVGTNGQVLAVVAGVPAWQNGTTGDIEGVTAGVGISGGGTSGTVTVTNSMATAITTAGDLIKGTGSGTFDRLGIGSTSQVLTVVGGAPAWATPAAAGGMTLLSTTTLSGASTTISSISGSYKNLYVEVKDFIPSTGNETVRLRINGDSGSNYQQATMGGGGDSGNTYAASTIFASDVRTTGTASHNTGFIDFPDYANATNFKQWNNWAWFDNSNAGYWGQTVYGCYYKGTIAAISSLTFLVNSGTFTSGTVKVYGVN